MDLVNNFKQGLDVAMLKLDVIKHLSDDKSDIKAVFLVVAVSILIATLGYVIFPVSYGGYLVYSPDLGWVIGHALGNFVIYVIFLYLIGYLAENLFYAKISMEGFVRVMGHAAVISVLGIVPQLAVVGSIWSLVVLWKVLRDIGKLDEAPTVLLIIIAVIFLSALGYTGSAF